MLITLTSILFPELPALMATKDFYCALRLRSTLRKLPGWDKNWTLKKSFLVVKGGFIARPAGRHTARDIDQTQTINHIIDFEILIRLASAGCVNHEDFPTTKEINDKSKADCFAKGITLLQIVWFTTNFCYRVTHRYDIANLEAISMDWVICGVPALLLWWQCPQNIAVAFHIPVTKFADVGKEREPSRTSQSESANIQELLRKGYYTGRMSTYGLNAYLVRKGSTNILLVGAWIFYTIYINHSPGVRWPSEQVLSVSGICSSFSCVCAIIISMMYLVLEGWSSRSCLYGKYIEMLILDSPVLVDQETESPDRWLKFAAKVGIYDVIDMRQWQCLPKIREHYWFTRLLVVAVLTTLTARLVVLTIAIDALRIAPSGVYDVPKTWALEALVHVGG